MAEYTYPTIFPYSQLIAQTTQEGWRAAKTAYEMMFDAMAYPGKVAAMQAAGLDFETFYLDPETGEPRTDLDGATYADFLKVLEGLQALVVAFEPYKPYFMRLGR